MSDTNSVPWYERKARDASEACATRPGPKPKAGPLPTRLPDGTVVLPAAEAPVSPEEPPRKQIAEKAPPAFQSRAEYFASEDAVRTRLAFLCSRVMADPEDKPLVRDLLCFIADFGQHGGALCGAPGGAPDGAPSGRLAEEFELSLDILLRDVGSHGLLSGLAQARKARAAKQLEDHVGLALRGHEAAYAHLRRTIEGDAVGYGVLAVIRALRTVLARGRYAFEHAFVFEALNGLQLTDGVSDLNPLRGQSVRHFLRDLHERSKREVARTATKRQRRIARELTGYKEQMARESLVDSEHELVAVHSSVLAELMVVYVTILRREHAAVRPAFLRQALRGLQRYGRFLSVVYVSDVMGVLTNMLVSSVAQMDAALVGARVRLQDALVTGTLGAACATRGGRAAGQPGVLVDVGAARDFLLRDQLPLVMQAYAQKALAGDAYCAGGYALPLDAGLDTCLLVARAQLEYRGDRLFLQTDPFVCLFYALVHAVDADTEPRLVCLVRTLHYCLQCSADARARARTVARHLPLLRSVAWSDSCREVLRNFSQSLAKSFAAAPEDSD